MKTAENTFAMVIPPADLKFTSAKICIIHAFFGYSFIVAINSTDPLAAEKHDKFSKLVHETFTGEVAANIMAFSKASHQ
ncbi:hypothetical protein T12_16340 [Trichinella patagoniensis]|uniref:Uncharacterized protein n=1 Tax=Trichinella patagoniensis TaxID=990121 RepID=A0A0V0ZPG7_9BILA|nr:hypothetical protein T09_14760 [Trichinella sp. T9]KRY14566.1 hypothetical protein T12_16340 [Trichinella patagoniensis]